MAIFVRNHRPWMRPGEHCQGPPPPYRSGNFRWVHDSAPYIDLLIARPPLCGGFHAIGSGDDRASTLEREAKLRLVRDQEAIRDTTLECQQHLVRQALTCGRCRSGWQGLLFRSFQRRIKACPARCACCPYIDAWLNRRRIVQIASPYNPKLGPGRRLGKKVRTATGAELTRHLIAAVCCFRVLGHFP